MRFVVTGASRGLGQAICQQLLDQGHQVFATARSGEILEQLWGDNDKLVAHPADLSQLQEVEKLSRKILEHFEEIDGLINNAGMIQPLKKLADCNSEEWAKAIFVNLTAPSLLTKNLLPALQKAHGRVVNISSGAAIKTVEAWSAYCTSKAGLLHFNKLAAAEYPEVAFFSLRPGTIDTDMQQEIRVSEDMTEEDLAKFRGLKENGKLNPPEVPARSAVWLAIQGPHSRSGEFINFEDEEILNGISTSS